jgi:protease-4
MTNKNPPEHNTDSQTLLNKIVIEFMREQRRKRIWRWIYRIILLLLIFWVVFQFLGSRAEEKANRNKPHVGVVDVKGKIFESEPANGDNLVKGLDKAYENKSMKALIIRIDSPGGSPVQADYMYNSIRYYRQKYPKIKVYAVCMDACASAAYYLAVAAEEIYANPSSLVGSIGVLYNGFGFVDTLQKIGITRRLLTAGKNKGLLDPFSPVRPGQEQYLKDMLTIIHQQFINKVKDGRGSRLKIDDDTFSGLYWTGIQAKERGLIDGFASTGQLARDIIKVDKIIDYTYEESIMERVAKNIGTAMADQLPSALGVKPGIN